MRISPAFSHPLDMELVILTDSFQYKITLGQKIIKSLCGPFVREFSIHKVLDGNTILRDSSSCRFSQRDFVQSGTESERQLKVKVGK